MNCSKTISPNISKKQANIKVFFKIKEKKDGIKYGYDLNYSLGVSLLNGLAMILYLLNMCVIDVNHEKKSSHLKQK